MLRNLKSIHIWIEILVRIALIVAFVRLETVEPFTRKILPDEIWIYRFDHRHKFLVNDVIKFIHFF